MFKKKGISVVIGYVLLISFAIIISALLYQWLRSYVPREALECPDGVSLFLKDYVYDCNNENISITLKNNGRFNIAGYFIRATSRPDQELATINLIDYTDAKKNKGAIILGDENTNTIEPGDEITNNFDVSSSGIETFYSLQIIPVRWEKVENRIKFVSCGNARIEEELTCASEIPGGECNNNGTCDEGETCSNCPADCGICCGNGVIDSGEECDDGNTEDWNGICSADCSQYQWITFVSSEIYDGFLGGINGGDIKCNQLASSEGLTGIFKAWLSDSTENAKNRINDGAYYLNDLSNTIIADNKGDLLDGTIDNSINKDESGNTLSTYFEVWTGTNKNGIWAGIYKDCDAWATNQVGAYEGIRGLSTQIDTAWTNYTNADTRCNKNARIYCFQTS